MENIFRLSSLFVMPFWLLAILLPRWRWSQRVIGSVWIVAPAALLYIALIAPQLAGALPLLLNPTLSGIAAFLGTPAGATTAWVHFLAFDLFVGRWVYLDGNSREISPWLISPLLFLVLLVGPLGLMLYLCVRPIVGKRPHSSLLTTQGGTA
ncbi:MAG: DUF4281 domain-containing protein [Caldilineaceae bacterium]|nr:DUF4281 domain-containing protein [Caldilineaceae bacterium]